MTTTYTVLIYAIEPENGGGYWAKVAELPGCFTTADTIDAIEANARHAIDMHLEGLLLAGQPLPQPVARKLEVTVDSWPNDESEYS